MRRDVRWKRSTRGHAATTSGLTASRDRESVGGSVLGAAGTETPLDPNKGGRHVD